MWQILATVAIGIILLDALGRVAGGIEILLQGIKIIMDEQAKMKKDIETLIIHSKLTDEW